MNRKGFTLVEIMIVVAIVALLAAIAIPNLLRAKVNANESAAQSTLNVLATAAESYASANAGNYPVSVAAMLAETPPYLNENYVGTRQGYIFAAVTQDATGYCFSARPITVGTTGNRTYSVRTGAVTGCNDAGICPRAVCTGNNTP